MPSNSLDIEALRGAVLNKVLRLYAFFGAFLVIWAAGQEFQKHDYVLAVAHVAMYASLCFVVLHRRLSHRTRTTLLVAILLGAAASEYIYYGPFGEGAIFLISALALVALMIGRRAGYIAIALAVAGILLIALLHVSGHFEVHWLRDLKADHLNQWITTLIEISVFCAALNFMINTLFEQLVAGLEARKKSEHRYKLLADHIGDVVWTVDLEWRCTFASPSIQLLFGRTVNEVMGGDLAALGFDSIKAALVQYVQSHGNRGLDAGRSAPVVCDVRHRDGRAIPTESVLTMLFTDEGKPYGVLGVTRDISVRIALESDRQSLQDQLQISQRMESIGQLAGGVAHDLNNLLQGMLGYAELSLDKLKDDTPVRNDIEEIMKTCERARQLVQQLLAFGRRQVLELSTINLNDLIADLAGIIHRVIGDHITLDFSGSHDLLFVRADRGQVEQVLMNLCVNARDAMPNGGTLRIETGNSNRNPRNAGPEDEPAEYVVVTVSDSGCGMDEATIERLFEPFFTTKDVGKGTGLGLSTAFGIMQQHHGTITVDSAPGAGSTFRLYFPAAQSTAAPSPAPRVVDASGGTETILLADDNPTVLQVTILMLQGAGYRVYPANDGEEAIQIFNEKSHEIDLALLDVVMPGLGGKEVAKYIRERRPEAPIVFCSGFTEDTVHTDFVLDEGTTLVPKPFRRADLLRTLRESLDSPGNSRANPAEPSAENVDATNRVE